MVPLLSSFLKPVPFVSHLASSLRNGYWKRLHRMRLDVQQYRRIHPRRKIIFNYYSYIILIASYPFVCNSVITGTRGN